MTLICQFCQCLPRGNSDSSSGLSIHQKEAAIKATIGRQSGVASIADGQACCGCAADDGIAAAGKRSKTGGKPP